MKWEVRHWYDMGTIQVWHPKWSVRAS